MGGGGSAPKPPKFNPINIADTAQAAIDQDVTGFRLSDEDFAGRLPGLVSGRRIDMQSAYNNLTQPVSAGEQNQMATRALESSLATTGGGDPMAGIGGAKIGGAGSATDNAFGQNLANQFEQKQDYDRSYWEQLTAENLPRAFGISGANAADLAIFNAQGQAGSSQANYAAGVQSSNARSAASAANTQAAIGASIAVASIIATII